MTPVSLVSSVGTAPDGKRPVKEKRRIVGTTFEGGAEGERIETREVKGARRVRAEKRTVASGRSEFHGLILLYNYSARLRSVVECTFISLIY